MNLVAVGCWKHIPSPLLSHPENETPEKRVFCLGHREGEANSRSRRLSRCLWPVPGHCWVSTPVCRSAKQAVYNPRLTAFSLGHQSHQWASSLSVERAGVSVFKDWYKPPAFHRLEEIRCIVFVLREMEVGRRRRGRGKGGVGRE